MSNRKLPLLSVGVSGAGETNPRTTTVAPWSGLLVPASRTFPATRVVVCRTPEPLRRAAVAPLLLRVFLTRMRKLLIVSAGERRHDFGSYYVVSSDRRNALMSVVDSEPK